MATSFADMMARLQVPGVGGVPSAFSTPALDPGSFGTPDFGGFGVGGAPSGPQTSGFGLNMGTAQFALNGLQTLGGLWNSFQANKLAKKSFNFQKDYARTNLTNSTQSYNTQMRDRIDSRAFVQGMSADQANSYYNTNKLNLPANMQSRGG